MTGKLHERAILVTGASSGIGRAIAVACAAAGARVGVGFGQGRDRADAVVAAIAGVGGHAQAFGFDVTSPAEVERGVAAFTSWSGRLDGLVLAAGIATSGLLATMAPEDLARVVATNTTGPLLCARAALPRMLAQRSGVILSVGSVATSRPARGQAAYVASKASVEALTRAIAVEYGRKGVRAICLRPGPVDTPMLEAAESMGHDEIVARVPLRRVAAPHEIAAMAVVLLGDDASYVDGAVFDVDGGYAAS